tara:strand:- start:57 stop:656 length:600 start_codon:yes stop_codon:yes gene_type:complete
MNSQFFTCHCGKSYKTLGWLEKHQEKCKKRNRNSDKPKPKKKKISPEMRFKVWEKYVGNKINAKCFCCLSADITPFTSYKTFQAGHIKSEYNGGDISLENLLPICKICNVHMSTTNWDDYVNSIKMYRPRLYGGNIPEKTINKIKHIQLWWRNLKTKKREIIKKKKALRKYLNGYEMTTYTFMKKRRKKVKEKRKLIWR